MLIQQHQAAQTAAAELWCAVKTLLFLHLIKQAPQFIANTAAKIADTAAQIAMTAATVAWNAVCAIATTVTTALGAAIAFLTSPDWASHHCYYSPDYCGCTSVPTLG